MSDNLPAVPEPGSALVTAPADTDSWIQVMRPILSLAETINDTDFVPKGLRGNMPAVAAALLSGRELGLPPMTSLQLTDVVEGKPGLNAEGMRALVLAAGHEIEIPESTGATCTMRGRRRGAGGFTTVTWTIDMARSAGLAGKNNWKHFPRAMLQARSTTELCRLIFPDVIHGFRSVEELEDMSGDADEALAPANETATVTRSGGTRRRAAKKAAAAAPPQLAGPDDVPLPGEPGFDNQPSEEQDASESGAETAPTEAPSPASEGAASQPSADGREEAAPDERSAADEGGPEGPDESVSTDAPSGPPALDSDDGAVDAEIVGDAQERQERTPPAKTITRPQNRAQQAQFNRLGFEGENARDQRIAVTSVLVGRELSSSNELTSDEARDLIETLSRLRDREALDVLVQGIRDAEAGA